jgi:hypothetical protein
VSSAGDPVAGDSPGTACDILESLRRQDEQGIRALMVGASLLLSGCTAIFSAAGDGDDGGNPGFDAAVDSDGGGGQCEIDFADWPVRHRVHLDNAQTDDPAYSDLSATLVDLPVFVRTDALNLSPEELDDRKLRVVSDSGEELPYEVEMGSGGDPVLWFRVPEVAASSDQGFVDIYSGNAQAAASALDPADVWHGYAAVWHMAESNAVITDSTGTFGPPSTAALSVVDSGAGDILGGALAFSPDGASKIDLANPISSMSELSVLARFQRQDQATATRHTLVDTGAFRLLAGIQSAPDSATWDLIINDDSNTLRRYTAPGSPPPDWNVVGSSYNVETGDAVLYLSGRQVNGTRLGAIHSSISPIQSPSATACRATWTSYASRV